MCCSLLLGWLHVQGTFSTVVWGDWPLMPGTTAVFVTHSIHQYILGQSVRKARVNGAPKEVSESPQLSPRGEYWRSPEGFPKGEAQGKSQGVLQYSPEGLNELRNSYRPTERRPVWIPMLNEYLRNFPRGSIHHDTPTAFSQIFILTMFWTSSRPRANTAHASVRQEACQF